MGVRGRVVVVIEVQAVALCLEAKALVEDHGWVVDRDMEGHVFALAGLHKVVEHHLPQSCPAKVRLHHQEGDVGLTHLHIRCHEGTAHHHLPIQSHTCEVWVTEAVGDVHWPEEMSEEAVAGRHVSALEVAQVKGVWDIGRGCVVVGGVSVRLDVVGHYVLKETHLRGREYSMNPCQDTLK